MNSSKVHVKRKPICETATEDDVLSYDDFSVSPGSSLSSFQEMDLYDIPENSETGSSNSMQRPRSTPRSSDTQRMRSKSAPAHTQPKHTNNLNGTAFNSHEDENTFSRFLDKKTELLLVRSKTSSDGFAHHSNFNRNDSARMTVPTRTKYQNNPNLSDNSVHSKSYHRQNGVREKNQHQNGFKKDDKVNFSNSTVLSNMTNNSLRRSKSLKMPKCSYQIPVVPSTRSSELRLSKTRLESHYKTKNFNDEFSESENSYTTSECDSPFLTTGKKANPAINGYANVIVNGGNTKNTQNVFNNCCTGSQCNGQVSSEIKLACSPIMNMDGFSSRLSEVCNLITEKHPGEFQIIERLVEMQSAYEECNNSINETIVQLRQRIVELESKESVGITSLAIPLMNATSAFQSQIQDIINRKYFTTDFSVQVCNGQTQNSPLDEISNEANAVAAHIASLCLNKENEPRDQ